MFDVFFNLNHKVFYQLHVVFNFLNKIMCKNFIFYKKYTGFTFFII